MKNKVIIFTGASSFSGHSLISELNARGAMVIIFFSFKKKDINGFSYVKRYRINKILKNNLIFYDCKFGTKRFLNKISKIKKIDYFFHHHYFTKFYNDNNKYNLLESLNESNKNIELLIKLLSKKKIQKYIYSGSYFSGDLKQNSHFSKYGLSKFLTGELLNYLCSLYNIEYTEVKIPSVFGAYEDTNRLFSVLMKHLIYSKSFLLNFPNYKRDFIPVEVLSKNIIANVLVKKKLRYYAPSYLKITNREFVIIIQNLFSEYQKRKLNIIKFGSGIYNEPLSRINKDKIKFIKKDFRLYMLNYFKEMTLYKNKFFK